MEGGLDDDRTVLKQKLAVTKREAEVLLWIARGKSNRDIAEILDMSPRTVNKHLEQIFAKLGVESHFGRGPCRPHDWRSPAQDWAPRDRQDRRD